jgi:hypothetical protein
MDIGQLGWISPWDRPFRRYHAGHGELFREGIQADPAQRSDGLRRQHAFQVTRDRPSEQPLQRPSGEVRSAAVTPAQTSAL